MKTKLYLSRLTLLTAIPLLFLFLNASSQTCLTQSALGVASGSAFPNGAVYTTGTSTLKANSYVENANGGALTTTFTYSNGTQGNRTGFAALDYDNGSYDVNDRYYVTYTFSRPVTGLNFAVLDVDQSVFQDAVEIHYNGSNNIKATPAFYTLGGAAVGLDDETFMDGFEGLSNANPTDVTANINVNFGTTPITSVTITYFSGDDPPAGNPPAQQIGISDMCWTGYAVANPLCFQWENLGYANLQSLIASPTVLPTASDGNVVTLTNSFATNGGTITRVLSYRSDAQGAHTGYLNVEMDNDAFDPNDQMTVNMNFAKPVTGLKFALLDVDLSAGATGWQDDVEMYVNGVNLKSLAGTYTLGGTTTDVAVDNETYMDGFEGIAGNTASTNDFANVTFDLGSIKVTSLTLKYFAGTNAVGNPANQRMGVSDLCWNSDKDLDGVPDYIDIDDDNDGITDILESGGTYDPVADADGDGIPNYQDTTPGTGLPAFVDSNADGVNDFYDYDLDGIINAFDLDSDNDGIADIVENAGVDIDGDGRIDGTFADSDGDGLADKYDASTGGTTLTVKDTDGDGIPNSRDRDSDGDGIPDVIEAGGTDANNDGILDSFATDVDRDGLADSIDGDVGNDGTAENTAAALLITGPDANNDGLADSYPRANADGTGLPNAYDLDSDGDGILDVREAGLPDADNNGIADGTLGTDGWSDTVDAIAGPIVFPNTDNNGRPNYLDADSDNDGIKDNVEAQGNGALVVATGTDTDGDGIDNAYDNVPGTYGGNANNGLTPVNTDGVGGADYADLDSDNDGIPDLVEAGGIDTNGDGFVDSTTDTDGDGLADIYDTDNGGVNIANLDSDGDGIRNYRDKDSDNDGLVDVLEAGGLDANNDGVLDSFATDTDGDGLADSVDGDANNDGTIDNLAGALIITSTVGGTPGRPASYPRANADTHGLPNPYDLDSDDDGIPDIVEARGVDTNGDGRIDGVFADSDGDGLANTYDLSTGGVALTLKDLDGDGIPNSRDLDSDGDGIPDVIEAGGTDNDNDGFIDSYATDTDGDGLADAVDGDADNNGTIENINGPRIPTGADINADGIADSYPKANLDGTGLPNPYDLDSDGDGILDVREAGLPDADNNGIADGTLGTDGWSDTVDAIAGPIVFPNTDKNGNPNYLDIDSDNDGIKDNVEAQANGAFIAATGTDTDGDGIDNAYDNLPAGFGGNANNGLTPVNTDGATNPDYTDLDSDNDGITDLVEAGGVDTNSDGLIDNLTDTDGDGLPNTYDTDNGGVNIANLNTDGDPVPNYRDLDSDNDGIPDVIEAGGADTNNDGIIDTFATDTDADGLADNVDGDVGNDGTAENPTIALIYTGADGNADGIPDTYPKANFDATGLPNPYDLDADGDGILDSREAGMPDADNNGIADGTLGADGWSDTVDALAGPIVFPNTDGVAGPNYLDIDSDNDGIVDNNEAQSTAGYIAPAGADTDGDGIDNAYDNLPAAFGGNANNGISTLSNIDGDILPDYLDLDSDNDGYPDRVEGHDTDGDNRPDVGSNAFNGIPGGTADIDGDGLLDGYDNNTASPSATNSGLTPNSYPNVDGGTSERDWREAADADADGVPNTTDGDADNDGITNAAESGGNDPFADFDADGIPNYLDTVPGGALPAFVDANGDGINDYYDADQDGIVNALDLDSDNDGISDIIEAGGADADGNGRQDGAFVDTDGDGIANKYDVNNGGTPLTNLDTDGDGIPNAEDLDSDGDGIPDVIEAGGTTSQNNGLLANATVDSDGDGIANSVDGDANNDGTAENTAAVLIITGADINNDGRADTYPKANLDGTGLPNPYDLDSDGDGILDAREAGILDTDNNGIADGILGGDGWSDTVDALPTLTLPNSDGTGGANYLDIDSDDDGITDNVEGQSTASYLLPSGTDTDGDGIDNNYDNNNGAYAGNASNGLSPYNFDGVDQPDYLDTDSDNDGQSDAVEGHDYNGNGIHDDNVTLTGVDTDGDGLDDRFDLDNTGANVKNAGISNGGSTTNPPTPGAAGPVQKSNVGAPDRDFRNGLIALPVRLISFTGVLEQSVANLTWTADLETNFKEYVVERSFDNVNFTAVGTVPPKGNAVNTYTYPDNLSSAPAGSVYYRLKIVDLDGRYEYSSIIRLSLNNTYKLGVQVLPNPVRSSMFVKITSNRANKGVVDITSVDGKTLISQQVNVVIGDNVILIKEQGYLLNGYYIMTLHMDGKTFQEKVIISR